MHTRNHCCSTNELTTAHPKNGRCPQAPIVLFTQHFSDKSSSSDIGTTQGKVGKCSPYMSTSPNLRKRARSPPFPPIVRDYRPYSSGLLNRLLHHRHDASHKTHWDLYYRNNTTNGYKDRHYILREFHELREAIEMCEGAHSAASAINGSPSSPGPCISWLEAGCGVGNAFLPIYEQYGHLPQWKSMLGFDISSVAVQLLEEKRNQLPPVVRSKLQLCVLDPSKEDVASCPLFAPREGSVGPQRVNFISMIFVLCSIPVEHHARVVAHLASIMQPGGVFYFRDYGVDDHAANRFARRDAASTRPLPSQPLDQTFVRTNGTLSHFFSVDEVRILFTSAGFSVVELIAVEREVHNAKQQISLSRVFIQGRFRLSSATAS